MQDLKGSMTRPAKYLCYCFEIKPGEVEADLLRSGESNVLERIKSLMKEQGCACEIKNPSGKCCLPEVLRYLLGAQKEFGTGEDVDCKTPDKPCC